jgi:hypothetical protein
MKTFGLIASGLILNCCGMMQAGCQVIRCAVGSPQYPDWLRYKSALLKYAKYEFEKINH